jgi:hypothetical protein
VWSEEETVAGCTEKLDLGKFQQTCLVAHDLINKLSVIIGHCDLLEEEEPEDSACLDRLRRIRDIAKGMAIGLHEHECHVDAATKSTIARKLQAADRR